MGTSKRNSLRGRCTIHMLVPVLTSRRSGQILFCYGCEGSSDPSPWCYGWKGLSGFSISPKKNPFEHEHFEAFREVAWERRADILLTSLIRSEPRTLLSIIANKWLPLTLCCFRPTGPGRLPLPRRSTTQGSHALTSLAINNHSLYASHESAIEIFDLSRPGDAGERYKTLPSRRSRDGQKGQIDLPMRSFLRHHTQVANGLS